MSREANLTEAEFAAIMRRRGAPTARIPKKGSAKRGPNKWEREYGGLLEARRLAGEVLWYEFEGLRFRLADGAYYKPDYAVMLSDGRLELHEVKGLWREAARLRIKVAADRHPFVFVAVTKDGANWCEERFSAKLCALK